METIELQQLIADPTAFIERVRSFKMVKDTDKDHLDYLQYDPKNHPVLSYQHRPKKEVKKPNGIIDPTTKEEGTKTVYEEVARIPVAFQRIIVNRAIMFLTGIAVEFEAQATDDPLYKQLLQMVEKTWDDNKFEYKLDEIAEAMMSERECAVIFHFEEAGPEFWGELGLNVNGQNLSQKKIKHSIYKRTEGSTFYPVFNEVGDMTAFGREYEVTIGDKKKQHLDIYTADATYRYYTSGDSTWEPYTASRVNDNGELVLESWPVLNPVKKIPVSYFYQKRVEWADVEWAIEQFVKTFSDLSETNAYFGSPLLKAKGKIIGMASKGERGKIFQMDKDADLSYVTWNHAPESIRLELDMLKEVIYTITQTPDITFKELKGLGQLSGVALRMMFLDPHAKANRKQRGSYGEGVQRMVNYMKAAMGLINIKVQPATKMSIKPKFGTFLPENELEQVEIQTKKTNYLDIASGGKKQISQETATELSGLAQDTVEEMKRLKAEHLQELKEQDGRAPFE